MQVHSKCYTSNCITEKHNIPMKNSNQQLFSIAPLNCLTLSSSSSSSQIIPLFTFSAKKQTYFYMTSPRQIVRRNMRLLTLVLYVYLAIDQFISTQHLTQTTPLVTSFTRWMTKWKSVIVVCLLRIIIRPNFVYP